MSSVTLNRPRVLVVDDDAGMIRAVERVLAVDCEIRTAENATAALEAMATFMPVLVVSDIGLPGADGFSLMAAGKARWPGTDWILMTGAAEQDQHMVRAIREGAFYFILKPFAREVLRTLVSRCLELRSLREGQKKYMKRVDSELAEARQLQTGLLPARSGKLGKVRIETRCEACSELGGDFADFADAGKGRVAMLVADVVGHGVQAAMLTMLVKSAFRGCEKDGFAPLEVVRRMLKELAPVDDRRFVTLIAAMMDMRHGTLEYVNGGHPGGILASAGKVLEVMEPTGPLVSPLFAAEGDAWAWEAKKVALPPSGLLVLYTDGIIEARRGMELLGVRAVTDLVARGIGGATGVADGVLALAHAHVGGEAIDDDMTLIAAEW